MNHPRTDQADTHAFAGASDSPAAARTTRDCPAPFRLQVPYTRRRTVKQPESGVKRSHHNVRGSVRVGDLFAVGCDDVDLLKFQDR